MEISEQQEKWLQRTADLFFRCGIKSVTMDDVARELGISKKTLYQFVDNKHDLVVKVVDQHLREEVRKAAIREEETADALEEMLMVIGKVVKDMQLIRSNIIYDMQKYHREAWERLQTYQHGQMMDRVRNNLIRGIREGVYRTDFDVEMIARLHVAQSFLLFDESWFPQPAFRRDGLFREYILHYLHGLLSDEGRRRLRMKSSLITK